jgi:hypothetical protein
MRKLFVLAIVVLTGCGKGDTSDPADYLSEKERAEALWKIVRYTAKVPPGANHQTKFKEEFDDYYKSVVADYKLLHLKPKKDDGYWFLISRPARSITPMVEGIGGSYLIQKDTLLEYDEAFRMWKMPDSSLSVKGKQMFDRMVAGKELSYYYPKFTGDQYIEVPDGRFVYDKQKRLWIDTTGPDLSK